LSNVIKLFFIFFLFCSLHAKEFRVASYNVENLFDAQYSKKEYKEYIPNSKSGWNASMYTKKVENLVSVISKIDADIIALQEIESKDALEFLNSKLNAKKYPYIYIQKSNAVVKSALLSRYKITATQEVFVKGYQRPISIIHLDIAEHNLTLFLNHWPSYNNGNKSRIKYAKELKNLYANGGEYILLGDFNSPLHVRHDGWGNAVNLISKDQPNYNLWFELESEQRFSHSFFKKRDALDHIIVSKQMFDNKGIDYKKKSFAKFYDDFILDSDKNPMRWQISKKGKGKHLGLGYSDHLPLFADFEIKDRK
jgi:endonuclease/exonuclease/phosphatase family metal-dependent hydrolase